MPRRSTPGGLADRTYGGVNRGGLETSESTSDIIRSLNFVQGHP